ncbi:MAG: hypothetical protein CMH27_11055 [Micavibrio sp.]|nr:hypothetical protein [Micavibrio sp.]|tara:strand:+ start:847 stop:1488 length:642 start_codon:yes stop_codon:yes gene_type:complete
MAKNQSKLRHAVDAVFGSAQYLTHDGAAYSQSKLGQIFNRASKPHYLAYGVFAAAEAAIGGTPNTALDYGTDLALIAFIDLLDRSISTRTLLKGLYFDTKGETKGFVDAPTASALKHKIKQSRADTMIFGTVAAVFTAVSGTTEMQPAIPYFGAAFTMFFGNYWRSKQVLDGNWTLLDKTPPAKQTSREKSMSPGNAMPVKIYSRDISPALDL